MFPCPSPKGTNHAGLYIDRGGNLVDKTGALWGRRGTMAMDSLPENIRPGESHLPPEPKVGPWHDSVTRKVLLRDELPPSPRSPRSPRAPGSDAERRLDMLLHFLLGLGLSRDDAELALEHARADLKTGEVEDQLPVSGPGGMGGRMSKQSREGGEKIFEQQSRAADNEEDFLRRFPDARRVGGGTPAERPLSAKDRQLAADRANSEASALRRFPELARIRIDGSGRA
jgi:hypothetical protein